MTEECLELRSFDEHWLLVTDSPTQLTATVAPSSDPCTGRGGFSREDTPALSVMLSQESVTPGFLHTGSPC